MSSQFGLASPRRSPRTVHDPASPAAGALRVPAALRYRGGLPPSSPQRPAPLPLQQTSQAHGVEYPRGGAVRPSASSYAARQGYTDDHTARQEDEDHSSLQVILLLTLSVVLLTLPWVVDHPITLLFPLALLVLPITSGAVRSLFGEGFSLLVSGARWFWRHRTQSPQAPPRAPRPQPAPAPAQPAFHPTHTMAPWQQQQQQQAMNPQGQPPAAYAYEPWRASPSPLPHRPQLHPQRQHAPTPAGARAASPGARPQGSYQWSQRQQQAPLRAAAPLAPQILGPFCRLPLPGPELDTPDLDFESDSDMEVLGDRAQSPFSSFAQQHQQQNQHQQHQQQHSECTVYNWDEPTECTHRKGPKSLADLLSNGV
ncbi:hypothetical protein TSOC_000007 [Tetrabaena socialis]|uniref:Uncharacterized protein n=1 Tax=Tetrabaena socialis TaxID=47790 RepID=A0A2J8AKH1_9CHLO|nr:hypothetical protein TSOC_000007 [Tetrabaena socialis]|eukprot:PNH13005.1 hypothetical protein TSOC_000007 [Tetrabaena socialis]